MRRAVSLVIFFSLASLAEGQERPKEHDGSSPSGVIKLWNDAVARKHSKLVAELVSKDAPKRTLEILQQQTFLEYQGETRIIHEEISGDRAVVVYRLENRGALFTPEVRYDVATLVREDGHWKVSPNGGGVLKLGKQIKR